MSGRVLDAVRVVPAVLWRHLGEQFNVVAQGLASLWAKVKDSAVKDFSVVGALSPAASSRSVRTVIRSMTEGSPDA
jgi:hypothetical protein